MREVTSRQNPICSPSFTRETRSGSTSEKRVLPSPSLGFFLLQVTSPSLQACSRRHLSLPLSFSPCACLSLLLYIYGELYYWERGSCNSIFTKSSPDFYKSRLERISPKIFVSALWLMLITLFNLGFLQNQVRIIACVLNPLAWIRLKKFGRPLSDLPTVSFILFFYNIKSGEHFFFYLWKGRGAPRNNAPTPPPPPPPPPVSGESIM